MYIQCGNGIVEGDTAAYRMSVQAGRVCGYGRHVGRIRQQLHLVWLWYVLKNLKNAPLTSKIGQGHIDKSNLKK